MISIVSPIRRSIPTAIPVPAPVYSNMAVPIDIPGVGSHKDFNEALGNCSQCILHGQQMSLFYSVCSYKVLPVLPVRSVQAKTPILENGVIYKLRGK